MRIENCRELCKQALQIPTKAFHAIGSVLSALGGPGPYETPGHHKSFWGEYYVIHLSPKDADKGLVGFLIEKCGSIYDLIDGRDGYMGLPRNERPDLRAKYITQKPEAYFPSKHT